MEINIKTVDNESFKIEVQNDSTILSVKEKIGESQGWPLEGMRLIYAGKILKDDQTVEQAGVQPNAIVVCMARKKNVARRAPSSPAVAATPAPTAGGAEESATGAPSAGGSSGTTTTTTATSSATTSSSTTSSGAFAALRQSPQFNQLRRAVQANPAALPQIIQLIGQTNPQLLEAINENREAFVELLNEPIPEGSEGGGGGGPGMRTVNREHLQRLLQPRAVHVMVSALTEEQRREVGRQLDIPAEELPVLAEIMRHIASQHGGGEGGSMEDDEDGGGGGGGGMGGPATVSLTPEEMEQVTRLQEVTGVSQSEAAQAYVVCDKNFELAANYLLENRGM